MKVVKRRWDMEFSEKSHNGTKQYEEILERTKMENRLPSNNR